MPPAAFSRTEPAPIMKFDDFAALAKLICLTLLRFSVNPYFTKTPYQKCRRQNPCCLIFNRRKNGDTILF